MDDTDFFNILGFFAIFGFIFLALFIFAGIWADNRPYNYTAKYCAGSICDTMSQEEYTEKNECPKTRMVQVAAFSDINGDLVEGTCKVRKR